MSTISITVNPTGGAAISPYLFGHNLEHTRAAVYGGLSAQMIRNRKFAGRPARRLGVSKDWFPIGDRAYFRSDTDPYVKHLVHNNMNRFNELNAQTVQNPFAGVEAGIGQSGLSIRASETYEFALVAKCFSPATLTVALTSADGSVIYDSHTIALTSGDYARHELTMTTPQDDDAATLRMSFTEQTMVRFGAVSMLPKGHFHGLRRDVVDCMKQIGVSILRWPGGNFAGEYRWRDMFLPVDERAPMQAVMEEETQPYSHGYDNHEIDTDTFIALCREIGAEPYITLNLAWETPEVCAKWVEYCNGGADTEYGAKRAERGHAEPYNVKFWSLGNEMGYGHMEGPSGPESYAALAHPAAEVMLSVSEGLTICSSGPYHPGQQGQEWLSGSAEHLKDVANHVAYHTYSGMDPDYTSEAGRKDMYRQAERFVSDNLKNALALGNMLPEGVKISYDEWNLWAAWYSRPSAVDGLFAAGMLSAMNQHAHEAHIEIMCFFQPIGEGVIDVFPHSACLTSAGQAFALMKAHKGGALCGVTGADGWKALATRQGDTLTLSLINFDYDHEQTYDIEVPGQVTHVKCLAAQDTLPGAGLSEITLPLGKRVTLPPRSVARLTIAL